MEHLKRNNATAPQAIAGVLILRMAKKSEEPRKLQEEEKWIVVSCIWITCHLLIWVKTFNFSKYKSLSALSIDHNLELRHFVTFTQVNNPWDSTRYQTLVFWDSTCHGRFFSAGKILSPVTFGGNFDPLVKNQVTTRLLEDSIYWPSCTLVVLIAIVLVKKRVYVRFLPGSSTI